MNAFPSEVIYQAQTARRADLRAEASSEQLAATVAKAHSQGHTPGRIAVALGALLISLGARLSCIETPSQHPVTTTE